MVHSNGTILVIDDILSIRDIVASFLTGKGFLVYEAANIKEALEIYDTHKIDVIITDIVMPHGDGVRLIMDLKSRNPDVRIIAMSGAYNKDKFLELAKTFGAHEILCKPFKTTELSEVVDKVLSRHIPSSTSTT
jgi:DNA-binding NtrC family response regulator